VIPVPDQAIALLASFAVRQHCPRFAFAYSPDPEAK